MTDLEKAAAVVVALTGWRAFRTVTFAGDSSASSTMLWIFDGTKAGWWSDDGNARFLMRSTCCEDVFDDEEAVPVPAWFTGNP